jgi:hypothetical protein
MTAHRLPLAGRGARALALAALVTLPRAARGARALALAALVTLAAPGAGPARAASSLRFFGNGVGDIDRVKIRIDDPATALPGPPADAGATDFTLEFWLRAGPGDNPAPAVACGTGVGWIEGNIIVDRDRYDQDRKFGISLGAGRVAFGVSGDGTGDLTICGTTVVTDGAWHHVAVDRRRSDGRMRVFVDGALDAIGDGPDGDVSYPDDGVPGPYCGGPCTGSDPFLVLAAEKHDAGPAYPSFRGWLDELRLSGTLRYEAPFAPPAAPFADDPATLALYHFDEGAGDTLRDAATAPGGPSPGVLRYGGSPAGPVWDADRFAGGAGAGPAVMRTDGLRAVPDPARTGVRFVGVGPGTRALEVCDAAGRRVAVLDAVAGAWSWDLRDAGSRPVAAGVYIVRARPAGAVGRVRVVR